METKKCQLCDSAEIETIIDLGSHPLGDTFLKDLSQKETFYPLRVFLCKQCGYTGLSYIVDETERYQKNDYSYTSSNSPVAISHFSEMASQGVEMAKISKNDLVIDIGSNVGTLLKSFREKSDCKILGVEPASNIAVLAEKEGVATINDFFNEKVAQKIVKEQGKAKVIACTNTFNHINDLGSFMGNIATVLVEDGHFIFEVPYMKTLVESSSFDTIYLEHISYFSVKPFSAFFKKFGLFISHLEVNDYMGGSIRVYVSKKEASSVLVEEFSEKEELAGIFDAKTYQVMMEKVKALKFRLCQEIYEIKGRGAKIIGIGAATKGNTLLNFCKIDNSLIDFITDSSPLKIGKFTPGSHIVIKGDKDITPDIEYALILPWNIAEFLREKLKDLNLKFIVPKI